MASENQQQEFELLTDDDDWSDSPKAGKKNSLWNTNAVVVKSNDLLTAKTNLTLNELRIILVAITTEALSAPSDPTVKNEMSSVGFLRSLIEAA